MSKDFILKKLEQIRILLVELDEVFAAPFSEFKKKFTNIRTAERDFQLIVELASDINAHILVESGKKTPDSYRESFTDMEKHGIIPHKILQPLTQSVKLRNILIHEYDFDEDKFIFYKSVKSFLAVYKEYIAAIQKSLSKK